MTTIQAKRSVGIYKHHIMQHTKVYITPSKSRNILFNIFFLLKLSLTYTFMVSFTNWFLGCNIQQCFGQFMILSSPPLFWMYPSVSFMHVHFGNQVPCCNNNMYIALHWDYWIISRWHLQPSSPYMLCTFWQVWDLVLHWFVLIQSLVGSLTKDRYVNSKRMCDDDHGLILCSHSWHIFSTNGANACSLLLVAYLTAGHFDNYNPGLPFSGSSTLVAEWFL